MKKQSVILGIIVLLVCVGLSGCTNPLDTERNKFIGTWTEPDALLGSTQATFFSDGTCSMASFGMRWDVKEGHLVISNQDQSLQLVYSYSFSNNDRTLTLVTNGVSQTLTKQ